MKHIKHWLATMAVLLCSVTANAHNFEVGGIYYSITSEEDLTVAVTFRGDYYSSYSNEYSGAVTIPSTVTYYSKTYSVTSIGDYAFRDCSNLTSITIPEGVTSIGDWAFMYCSSLTSITIPEGVTSIGERAFYECSSLTAINIPENSKLTSIEYEAFYKCSSLTVITLPEGVTSIGYQAFYECSSLTSITIPEGVTSIAGGAFDCCSSLTSITIPEGVTSIAESAFAFCSSLTAITIPEGVTSIRDWAFMYCRSLTSITLPEGVTSIGESAFSWCSSLTAITLPEGVTSIGESAFYNCSSLTAITCHAVTLPTVGNSYTFYGVDKSIPVYVPEGSVEDYKAAEYWKDFTNITALTIPTEVTITINQYGSGTYCSEYALDFSEVEGLKAYAATGYDTETGVVTLSRVMTAKAGVGLFIKGEPGDYVVPVLENTSFNTLNMLVGTLEDVIVNGTDGLYTNYKYAAPDGEPLFYQFADGSTQKAGRAYLQIPTSWLTTTAAKSISYRFDDGETTDIENSEITTPNSEFIYDLYGRRVENPVKGGVYIVKGKKIVY